MIAELKERFPSWVLDDYQYSTCLSDDIDSWLSCAVLKTIRGYEVDYFYDFNNFYSNGSDNKAICIDADMAIGRCWSNHCAILNHDDEYNQESANINNLLKISRNTYMQKFAGSTLLQIMSYYDVPLPKNEEALMLLLAIDCSFKGFYNNDFKKYNIKHLESLELWDLIEVLKNHEKQDFYSIIKKYRTYEKIHMVDGKLTTKIDLAAIQPQFFEYDLSLPKDTFVLKKLYNSKMKNLHKGYTYSKYNLDKNIISLAITSKNHVRYTTA